MPDWVVRLLLASQAASLRELALDGPTAWLGANASALPELRHLTSVSLSGPYICSPLALLP